MSFGVGHVEEVHVSLDVLGFLPGVTTVEMSLGTASSEDKMASCVVPFHGLYRMAL